MNGCEFSPDGWCLTHSTGDGPVYCAQDAEEALFDHVLLPHLVAGDRVLVRTIWGEEKCRVVGTHFEDGFPMVKLTTGWGDTISVNVAAVKRLRGPQ